MGKGNSLFEITFQEFEMYHYPSSSTNYYDAIFGKYRYIEYGNLITEIGAIETGASFNVSMSYRSPSEYYILIRDLVSERSKKGIFVLISPTTAVIKLEELSGIRLDYGNGQDDVLPTSMTLTKQ